MADDVAIKETVMNLLAEEHLCLTPSDLERAVRRKFPSSRRHIRQAVRELVSLGRIAYTQRHSTTHLERNHNRPVQVSDRIVLSPFHHTVPSEPDRAVIKLQDGTSFGGGDHPTTRMILRAMDLLLSSAAARAETFVPDHALDIGTGTGVLAIAAAILGIAQVDAVDIDTAACHEAKQNARLNDVHHCVHISNEPLSQFSKGRYDLILANLRPPTIKQLIPMMTTLSSARAVWIISGCRPNERERLKKNLPLPFSKIIWQADSADWAAFAVQRVLETK